MQQTRVFEVLDKIKARFSHKDDMLACKTPQGWRKYGIDEIIEQVNAVSSALLEAGIKTGDKVGIMANNRPEWNFVDYGCQQIGAVLVPIFPTVGKSDLEFILNHAEIKHLFISSEEIFKKIKAVSSPVEFIYAFDEVKEAFSFEKFIANGKENLSKNLPQIEKIKASVQPDDLFTILYTSGTTGIPKGVMLSHKNLLSNMHACENIVPFKDHWRALSFLPLNHIYERMINTLLLNMGSSVYYAQGFETISENLKEVKPHLFGTVPRLLELVYDKLITKGNELKGVKKKLFFWAVDIGLRYEGEGKNSFGYELKRKIADKLIYSKWREALGGNTEYIISGGAALQTRLAKVFTCAKLNTLEGYGLTETSPVIAVNKAGKGNNHIGTVGPVLDNIELKLAEDGEIILKAPSVMLGYYKNEAATAEVIDCEGYFHTGDVGMFVNGNFLKITDRKKEIFKTSAGKYIAPLVIENMLKECRLVEQCMVIGEQQKFASALIVPSAENAKRFLAENGLEAQTETAKTEALKKEISLFIRDLNKRLAPYEQLKRVELLTKSWSIEGGELTPKMSMKRKAILEKNKEAVQKIYSVD